MNVQLHDGSRIDVVMEGEEWLFCCPSIRFRSKGRKRMKCENGEPIRRSDARL